MYIVIAGAGLVGRSLAERLVKARHDVVVIDSNPAVCEYVAAHTGAVVQHGSATNVEVLRQAGIERADVAVSTMRGDADNLAFAILARSFGVERVIARLRDHQYESAYRLAGVTTTIQVADVFAGQLMLEIEEPHLRQVYTFAAGGASIVVDTVPDGARAAGMTVAQVTADPDFPDACVITGIYRPETQTFIIPRGEAELRAGDRVFLVAARRDLRRASRFLHRKG